jgi:hypothetical protein
MIKIQTYASAGLTIPGTQQGRILPEKLTVTQQVKKFLAIKEPRSSTSSFMRTRLWSPFKASRTQPAQ